MVHSSEEDSDMSESELEDYGDKCYKEIKNGELKVKISEGVFRCPFCQGKKKQNYMYKDLLQHASRVGKGSHKNIKLRANHLALAKYLERDLAHVGVTVQSAAAESKPLVEQDRDEVFVYPWIGILVNIPTEFKYGKYVGERGSSLRDQLTKKGFNPVRVTPLWNYRGHTGKAIVEFRKDWYGFHNAMSFEKSFEADHHGKRDWCAKKHNSSSIYGWVARDDDYNSKDIIGEHLHINGDLKTTAEIVAEEEQILSILETNLAIMIDVKNQQLKETLMDEKDKLHHTFNEKIKKTQLNARDHFQRIFHEHEKQNSELDSQRKELKRRGKELEKCEAQNENERKKLIDEKKKNAVKNSHLRTANFEQKKADENVLRLAEDQKMEKEKLLNRILQLVMQLNAKQALELDIERLKGNLIVMKHMGGEEDAEVKKKLDELSKSIEEKEEELEDVATLNQTLIFKERKSNDELQEARKELIDVLKGDSARAAIGVKEMGELDSIPYQVAGKRKYIAPELWNWKEGRKATFKEGLVYILKQRKTHKRKR